MRTKYACCILLVLCLLISSFNLGSYADNIANDVFVQSFEKDGLALNSTTNFSFSESEAHSGSRSLKMLKTADVTNTNSFSAIFQEASDGLNADMLYKVYFYLKPVWIEKTIELQFFRNATLNSQSGNNASDLVRKFNLTLGQIANYEVDENGWYKIPVTDEYQVSSEKPYMNLWCCQWDGNAEFYIDDITFEPITSYGISENLVEAHESYWSFGKKWSSSTGFNDNGSITVTGGTGIATFAGKTVGEETIRVKLSADITSSWAAVSFRNSVTLEELIEDGQNGYYISSGKSYALVITAESIRVKACYSEGNQTNVSEAYAVNLSDGKEHLIEIETLDNVQENTTNIKVYIDGVLKIDCTDTVNAVMPEGYVSVVCSDSKDSVTLTGLEIDGVYLSDYSVSDIDTEAVSQVISLIQKLPEKASLFNKTTFINAYDVYSALSENEKTYVSNSQVFLKAYNWAINLGDINTDGTMNIIDLVRIKKFVAQGVQSDESNLYGDLDADDCFSAQDIIITRKLLLNIYDIDFYYDLDNTLTPYWKGSTVYNESVSFEYDIDGSLKPATLKYLPKKVLSVRSVDLGTVYTEGVDYTVSGKNIVLTKNSAIKAIPFDTQYPEYAEGASVDWLQSNSDSGRYTALKTMRDYQVAVTYTHNDEWQGDTPEKQLSRLTRTKERLENGESVKIVFYGDSITAGYEASGQSEFAVDMKTLKRTPYVQNNAPYLPAWATLVTQGLKKQYPQSNISAVNLGAPSSASKWGAANVNLLNAQKPDLAVIAFGMNEAMSQTAFKTAVSTIIADVSSENPDTEFLLVSACVPNTECVSFYNNALLKQEKLLEEIQQENEALNIAVAPVQSMNLRMIEMGKKPTDGLNNNLNHPNDFIVRLYAQTILETMS